MIKQDEEIKIDEEVSPKRLLIQVHKTLDKE